MSTPRRSKPIVSAQGALTPQDCGTPTPVDHYNSLTAELARYRAEGRQLRHTLRAERKRAGSVEAVLVRHITSLEQQVNDLRSAYFTNLAMPTAPNTNPKVSKQ